jgi:hypothetical protein
LKISNAIAVAGIGLAAVLLFSTDSNSQDTCQGGGNHTIQVSPGGDGSASLKYRGGSAENVHVCSGDQVQWVLSGSDRDFFIDFFDGAPFPGAAKRGSSDGVVAVQIDAESGAYNYGVNFAGDEPMDPAIIVD